MLYLLDKQTSQQKTDKRATIENFSVHVRNKNDNCVDKNVHSSVRKRITRGRTTYITPQFVGNFVVTEYPGLHIEAMMLGIYLVFSLYLVQGMS
ncbi:hypothetical protein CEXT_174211 [Caerostris extrusa]|uniref:Uncharacterized protein n=1 Tax=Caerostris extrusa TaxID=172846 RepID=A0AAV4R7M0_CAEEX|nr:hypothetical protein CEXT_174211 [Caerostris extrusa]